MPCHAMSCHGMPCHAMSISYHIMSCHVMSYQIYLRISYIIMSYHASYHIYENHIYAYHIYAHHTYAVLLIHNPLKFLSNMRIDRYETSLSSSKLHIMTWKRWVFLRRRLKYGVYIDGLEPDYNNSIANALELMQSCAKPLIVFFVVSLNKCRVTGYLRHRDVNTISPMNTFDRRVHNDQDSC